MQNVTSAQIAQLALQHGFTFTATQTRQMPNGVSRLVLMHLKTGTTAQFNNWVAALAVAHPTAHYYYCTGRKPVGQTLTIYFGTPTAPTVPTGTPRHVKMQSLLTACAQKAGIAVNASYGATNVNTGPIWGLVGQFTYVTGHYRATSAATITAAQFAAFVSAANAALKPYGMRVVRHSQSNYGTRCGFNFIKYAAGAAF
jgi:hypothetical protein